MPKPRARDGNLPYLATSFVGRRRQRKEVRERLAASRLVSLVGPGGVGKTRLAVQVADEISHLFADGVYFVEFGSVSEHDDLATIVVHALGIRDQSYRQAGTKIWEYLRNREVLLVFDNCEHVMSDCIALIREVLHRAPAVRILVTTRTSLSITEEFRYPVPPLTIPDPATTITAESLAQFESIRLMVARAEAALPQFVLTDSNAQAAAQLCIQLEGIPLAIELAVARLRMLSLDQIVDRLSDRFRLLTAGNRSAAPRQQTLRSLIDWSFALCTEAERRLWARLSVFAGGFDLTAVEGVCATGRETATDYRQSILDLLSSLADQSVLNVESHESSVRFRMLETIRAYGAEILELTGESEQFRNRHRVYFLDLVKDIENAWCGPDQEILAKKMRLERENLRAALDSSSEGSDEYHLELVAGLRYRWYADGYIAEGRAWADEVLDRSGGTLTASPARTKALWVAAWVSLLQGEHEVAGRRLDECERAAEELHIAEAAAYCRGLRGLAAQLRGELAEAERHFAVALPELADVGEIAGWLMTSFEYATVLSLGGRSDDARAISTPALAMSDRKNERWARSYLKWCQGLDHWLRADFSAALDAALDALRDHRVFDQSVGTALMIELLAWIAGSTGQVERAAELIGGSRSLWRRTGTELVAFGPKLTGYHFACVDELQRALSSRALTAALTAGARRAPIDIVAYALSETGDEPHARTLNATLTNRQLEIAELVSQGLTSREIAAALMLSVRTVESHIENILVRLGYTSRAQIAAWHVAQTPRQ